MPSPDRSLFVENITKSYGGGPLVLKDLTLEVSPGELLGVIGPNGSGKTTLFGVIAGQLSPSSGKVCVNGRDITRLPASERARNGIGRTFQVPQCFFNMSVFENLLVGARYAGDLSHDAATHSVHDILERTGFRGRGHLRAGDLPLLDRKRLELARALATGPSILLLDEIAGGLTDNEAAEIATLVKEVNSQGVTVIWIEHLVHILTSAVSRIVVLGEGRIIADGEPHETMATPAVRQIYLGMEPDPDA
ncbi:ABC transporter ATP-binding protein [Rhizobium sp. ICMP 5592]|nr:ABC transporter ATP-binding protein [Rhizobium sp. ICMP 5592]